MIGTQRAARASARPLAAAIAAGALLVAGCGSGTAEGEHLSRDLLIYSSTTYVPVRATTTTATTTSTTTTTSPPALAPVEVPTTAAPLLLPPPPPPAPPAPPPAVQQASERANGLETVLGELEQAIGKIDEGIGNSEDQG